ncbi:MAG TPA: polyphosphate:AMP phosphotransferase, partial [Longimicrobiales bacterium]
KGDTANVLNEWLDARLIETIAFDRPTEVELERPPLWRFWRDLPRGGRMAIYLSAWYSRPFLMRVHGDLREAEYQQKLDEIVAMEQTFVDDGAVILKFWMHLGKQQQKASFERLEADPLWSWRVTERDWRHWEMYDQFEKAAEFLIVRTSSGAAPWKIVEGADKNFRELEVAEHVLAGMRRAVQEAAARKARPKAKAPAPAGEAGAGERVTILSRVDMDLKVAKDDYNERLPQLQGRLNRLYRHAKKQGNSTVIALEGWDAGGKGGAIRRLLPAMDARDYDIHQITAPNDEERARHYLWRFWRRLPRAGEVAIFDRTWYGRVLVERIEGFASVDEWRRAYAEINDFERRLTDHGIILIKFWLHITPEEQEKRFKAREKIPFKQYKLTEEDWRNRERWAAYELAVNEMIERTSAIHSRWTIVPANDKRHSRLTVLETVCDAIERKVGDPDDVGREAEGAEAAAEIEAGAPQPPRA